MLKIFNSFGITVSNRNGIGLRKWSQGNIKDFVDSSDFLRKYPTLS